MYQIYVPTKSAEDWRRLLADPKNHWKDCKSAKMTAERWEECKASGLPDEIALVFQSASAPGHLKGIVPILALPEYHVPLEGGTRDSQTDVFVLAKDADCGLVSIAVEGKYREDFGGTMAQWRRDVSSNSGKPARIKQICGLLGLKLSVPEPMLSVPDAIRYQLLHRTASAIILAKRFNARTAVMLVHSFSKKDNHFGDFGAFVRLFEDTAIVRVGELVHLTTTVDGIRVYAGWARGPECQQAHGI